MKLPLKPCPFSCRCPAATFILGSGKWGIHVNSKANVHHESIYRVFGTEQEAAEWWNNRPGEAAILDNLTEEE